MKRLIAFLIITALVLNASAQVHKYLSTEQGITNVDFSIVKGYDKIYLTFDYNAKTITLSNPSKASKFTFKILSQYAEKGTMVGDTRNIRVSSTNAPAVKRFYFSNTFSDVVFMENNNGKTTAFGGLTKL